MIIRKVEPKRYIKRRIIATCIDYGIYILLCIVYIYCVGYKNDAGVMEVDNLLAFPLILLWFLYFVITETINQATPGHDICKLIVLKSNAERITFSDVFKRRIVDMIDIGVYGIPALICIYNTPKYQRLGDLLADTVVVKKSDIIETEVIF
jgi:uncharacterized RDD family membrane protein YckC